MKVLVALLSTLVVLTSGFDGGLPMPEGLLSEGSGRAVLSNCGASRYSYDGDRIVGGRDAVQGELPWQVSLQRKSWNGFSHICGGTVLNSRTIVTAAHCVDGGAASNYQIVVGAHNMRKPSQYHKAHTVSSIKMHEQYNPRTISNDIAIIILSSPIDVTGSNGFVNGACLPGAFAEPTGTVSVSGWGAIRQGGGAPDVLQVVDVPVVSRSTCRSQYGASSIADHMLCAGLTQGGKDSCQGDSGGPLVQRVNGKATLVGVVSWGAGCAQPNKAGVYTQVSHFIPWIQKNAQ